MTSLHGCCGLEGPEMKNTKRCKVYRSIYGAVEYPDCFSAEG